MGDVRRTGLEELPAAAPPTRALIVEDLPAARTILETALRSIAPDIDIVVATTLAEAAAHDAARFDLALVDLGLPDGRGATLIRTLKRRPSLIVAAVTVMDDDPSIEEALAAGADGYLLKDSDAPVLRIGLMRLMAGEPSLSPAIARRVLARFAADAPPADDCLSAREREVLSLVARGLRAPEAATTLGISVHTVRDHVKSIYRKLDVSSRAEATLEAQRRRLT